MTSWTLDTFFVVMETWAFCTVIGIFIFGMDDVYMDLVAFCRRLRPRPIDAMQLKHLTEASERRISVVIANWHEDEILEPMVSGNLSRILYQNYCLCLGVYPNDERTVAVAFDLANRFPGKVSVVVNSRPGPTSKGQMLNEMFNYLLDTDGGQPATELFIMHDSEDLVHPLAFKLMNQLAARNDFIQIPVFSLENPRHQLVAGTYIDEFAEAHTRDMIVRSHLKAPVPSAGVGTAISRDLVLALRAEQNGQVLDESSLTEDYQLGHTAARLGFKTKFICYYVNSTMGRDYVATREYFPDGFKQSVRQKTRWTLGIALQGRDALGWGHSWREQYFLWRDRRSIWNGLLTLLASALLLTFTGYYCWTGSVPEIAHNNWFQFGCFLNLGQMCWRVAMRMRAVGWVYGWASVWLVPLRWPIANVINTWTAYRAAKTYRATVRKGKRPQWAKTQHRLPDGFGANQNPILNQRRPAV